ncbi:MAG: class I SAM-dependent methyltransferase [bacterium]|nr:class I SAM-dependent methyltransferase [bacterium]
MSPTPTEVPVAADRTIRDFGDQWSRYSDNDGYYASVELLQDLFGPLLPIEEVAGARTADIGAGTGRNTLMLLNAGAAHVLAVEPSVGVEALRKNLAERSDRVEILHARGDELPAGTDLDLVISIGVIQFIEEPDAVLKACLEALKPGGKLLIWVYSREGNETYIFFASLLRAITKRLPHFALAGLCSLLNLGLDLYIRLCRVLPLPMRSYVLEVATNFSRDKRKLVIYDQLNPSYVKWYTEAEVKDLARRGGFANVRVHHRHGYSWTLLAEKPSSG